MWAESLDKIILAGDSDQTIYEFKGATPDAFLKPEIPKENIRTLKQSYRVPKAVHAYSMSWIKQIKDRADVEYRPTDNEGHVVNHVDGNWKEPASIINDILCNKEKNQSSMVLASCSYMLQPTLAYLRESGVPFENRFRRRRGDWNPLHAGHGISMRDRVLAFLRMDENTWGNNWDWWNAAHLRLWVPLLESGKALKRGSKSYIKDLIFHGNLNIGDLFSLFESHSIVELTDLFEAKDTKGACRWLRSQLMESKKARSDYILKIVECFGGKALRETPKITVGTIHSIKGGEADVIYIFPDLSYKGMESYESGRETRDAVIRMFYVGFTRAKDTLVLCEPASERSVTF